MVSAVIFDMDGLLLDTQRVWDEVILSTAAEAGIKLKPGFLDAIRGSSGEAVVTTTQKWVGPNVDAAAFVKRFWDTVDETFDKGIDKKPGLDELLAWLKEHHVAVAVASGSTMQQITHHLAMCNLTREFSVTVSGFEVEHPKPAPDVFLETARRLGVDPAQTIVLEDSFNGIEAAYAGGFIPVMVPDCVQPTDEIRSLAKAVCDSLVDVIPLLENGLL